jgi:hypothetical protein
MVLSSFFVCPPDGGAAGRPAARTGKCASCGGTTGPRSGVRENAFSSHGAAKTPGKQGVLQGGARFCVLITKISTFRKMKQHFLETFRAYRMLRYVIRYMIEANAAAARPELFPRLF